MSQFSVVLPIRLPSVANLREHWSAKARRTKLQRTAAQLSCRPARALLLPVVVVLTRVAPRPLDDDNLASAFKATRDGVADALGIDDRDARIAWKYSQLKPDKGQPTHVRIEILEGKP